MGIKKYFATQDNTITNAFTVDLSTRGTGSNMGAADILEVFSIYGHGDTTSSAELSRTLIKFQVTGSDSIKSDREAGTIPGSGSVSFYLRMFNARHTEQLPRDYTLNVLAVSQSWQEGYGLDMEGYKDKTKDYIEGSNWINREKSTAWVKVGGDFHSSSYTSGSSMPNYTASFSGGDEDLLVDVTDAIEEWLAGNQDNNGFGIFLTSSQEAYVSNSSGADSGSLLHNTVGQKTSFYTKRFFSRTSEFFFKRPTIEARWDSRTMDDRGNFYSSSSMAPANENLNNLYLYNYIRGSLKDIPHTETIKVKLYGSVSDAPAGAVLASASASKVSTGVYKAQLYLNTTASVLHDIWSGSVGGEYKTGSISVKNFNSSSVLLSDDFNQYVTKVTNLKSSYSNQETARFRVFTRPRNFSPTLYTVASKEIEKTTIPSASFEIIRVVDNSTVINNSTSSAKYHTYLSYDNSGSYFDLDMSTLEAGYMYAIKLLYHGSDGWREQEELFKFRVESN
mgnify:CR=1 FL=1|tara:strand:- start:730 stop:2247 length:1518 start_codon:yes stop_codon:yes gene_type:complete